jgi:hypothetical protein
MDVNGRVQDVVDDTGAGQELQRGGFDRRSSSLLVRLRLTIHDPGADTVAGKLAGSEEPRGSPADNENLLHDASLFWSQTPAGQHHSAQRFGPITRPL